MMRARFDTVLVNGSVGTGKTTTAEILGDQLSRRGIPGAVIDVDWLRRSWPAPADDPFQTALALANTQAIAVNFRRAGAGVLVVATVIETVEELQRNAVALAARSMLHVHLTASPAVVLSRLAIRHSDDDAALRWHAHRHPELAEVLDQAGFTDDLRIDTSERSPAAVAEQVLAAVVP